MSDPSPEDSHATNPRRGFAWAEPARALWILVAALTIARLVWLIFFSDVTLIEDEAHYWEWSRRLGWSYATKGPGVAWVIAASTALFGNVEWAVRAPAVLASAVSTLAVGAIARRVFDDGRVGFFAGVVWQCLPGVGLVGVLMTIDGPYLACWALACWAWLRATRGGARWAWPACGLALAAGFLFKYTILLLLVGFAIDLLLTRKDRRPALGGALVALAFAAAGLVPVLVWNARHDWVTVHHLLGHLGLGADAGDPGASWSYSPLWTLEFLGLQLAAAGPAIVLMLAGLIGLRRARRTPTSLLALSLPVFVFYLLVTIMTRVEGNWTLAGFVTLCPLAGWMVVSARDRNVVWLRVVWGATALVGVLTLVALPIAPLVARGPVVGPYIPMTRMTGMRAHARAVQSLIDDVHERTGRAPFVVTGHYGRASQLAFYLPGQPTVYCATSQLGGSSRQYDHWPRTNLSNPDTLARLAGRPAIILVGGSEAQRQILRDAFESLEDVGRLDAEPKKGRTALVGLGFRGFAHQRPVADDDGRADP